MITGFTSIILTEIKRIEMKRTKVRVTGTKLDRVEVIKTKLRNAKIIKKEIPGIVSKFNLLPDA